MLDVRQRVIEIFENRGWALYRTPNEFIMGNKNLKEIISVGREKLMLEPHIYYLILPLIDYDKSYIAISEAVYKLSSMNRYPLFIQLIETSRGYETKAVFFVSAVCIRDDSVELLIDLSSQKQAGLYIDPLMSGYGSYSLYIPFSEIDCLEWQFLKAWRDKSIFIPRSYSEVGTAINIIETMMKSINDKINSGGK